MSELNPITREEMFLAKAAGAEVPALTPITRIERFLQNLIDHIKSIGTGGGGGATPDWNAAEGEPGHVLNRTHWTEKVNKVFIDNVTTDSSAPIFPDVALIIGQEYKILFNGVEYTDIVSAKDLNGMSVAYMGNGQAMGIEGLNEDRPYAFIYIDGMGTQMMDMTGAESATVTLSGVEIIVHKLPEQYLPDTRPYQVNMWSEGTSYYTLQTVYALEQAYNSGRQIVLRWASSLDASSEMIYFFVLGQRLRQDDVVAYGFYNAELNAKMTLMPNGMGGFDIDRSDI